MARKLRPKKNSSTNSQKSKAAVRTSKLKSSNKDSIVDYFNLCTKFELHVTEYRNLWKVTLEENLIFYIVDATECPAIIVSIKIDKNLKVHVFTEYGKIKEEYLKLFLNQDIVLETWIQLKSLLQYFGNKDFCNKADDKYLLQALKHLRNYKKTASVQNGDNGLKSKLGFIISQIYGLALNAYTIDIFEFAKSIYLKSSTTYKHIQALECLILPQVEDLQRYIYYVDIVTQDNSLAIKVLDEI